MLSPSLIIGYSFVLTWEKRFVPWEKFFPDFGENPSSLQPFLSHCLQLTILRLKWWNFSFWSGIHIHEYICYYFTKLSTLLLKKIFSRVQLWSTIPRRRAFAVKWMSRGRDLGGDCSVFPWSSFSENGFLFLAWLKISVNGMPRLQRLCPHSLFIFKRRGFGWRYGSFTKCLPYRHKDLHTIPSTHKKGIHIDILLLLRR